MNIFDEIKVLKRFNLSPVFWRVAETDLGGQKVAIRKVAGINGCPDALFKMRFLPVYIVGELKNGLAGAYPRWADYYQSQLYMWQEKKSGRFVLSGRLAYKNSLFIMPYNRRVVKGLLAIKAELIEAKKTWKAPNSRPLRARLALRAPHTKKPA